MRLAMIAMVVGASAALCVAEAQSVDHPSCAPMRAKWAEVSTGTDLAAMDKMIGLIPSLCPVLKSETVSGRADAVKRIEQERAARAAAARAADPCVQARNDWTYMQTASEGTVRAYRNALPAACAVWRNQADERLAALENQRIAAAAEAERQRQAAAQAAEQQRLAAERVQRISALAKATGVEGRWANAYSVTDKCNLGPSQTFTVDGEYLIHSFISLGETYRFRISRVSGSELWTAYSSNDGREEHYWITGNILRSAGHDTPDIVHMYVRC